MDTVGNKIAASEIAQIKVMVPIVALDIIDRAIQIHGGEGVSQVTPFVPVCMPICGVCLRTCRWS